MLQLDTDECTAHARLASAGADCIAGHGRSCGMLRDLAEYPGMKGIRDT